MFSEIKWKFNKRLFFVGWILILLASNVQFPLPFNGIIKIRPLILSRPSIFNLGRNIVVSQLTSLLILKHIQKLASKIENEY